MLLSQVLPALSLIVTSALSHVDDVPCLPSTTVSSSTTSCQKADLAEHVRRSQIRLSHLVSPIGSDPAELLQVSRKRIFKRQTGRGRMVGCGNDQLSQIMQHVVVPLLPVNQLKLGDIAQILQQSVQRATGKSFEILIGKGEMGIASHQTNDSASCRLRIGDYYTIVYETPVQYNIDDEEQEKILSNIDFGERLGGSGFPGQTPFHHCEEPQSAIVEPPCADSDCFGHAQINNCVEPCLEQPSENLLNRLFEKKECFSGDSIVETIEGPKRMRELKTGDEVMSIEEQMISFSPILMFLHRDEELLAEFNVITTVKGDSVKLTSEHLIYVSDCDPKSPLQLVKAKEVTTEHCLIGTQSRGQTVTDDRVTNITKASMRHTYERGIYAPLTSTGDIIVNNVLASCHSNLGVRSLQDSVFKVYRYLSFMLPEAGSLPFGIAFFTSALDLFIPLKTVLAL